MAVEERGSARHEPGCCVDAEATDQIGRALDHEAVGLVPCAISRPSPRSDSVAMGAELLEIANLHGNTPRHESRCRLTDKHH